MNRTTILHTNDFHGSLKQPQAERIRLRKSAAGPDTLLLDAGDAGAAGNITYHASGEPIFDLMNHAGYDAMTVGNRDFHFSRTGFFAKVSRANFPILCANVRPNGDGDLPVVPYVYKSLPNGLTVGVFGLTVPMITERMLSRKVSSFVFDSPVSVAKAVIPQLVPKVDLLICLSHLGLARDRELAEQFPELSLIVGGHTHSTLDTGLVINGVAIVQAGSHAHWIGVVELERTSGGWTAECKLEPL